MEHCRRPIPQCLRSLAIGTTLAGLVGLATLTLAPLAQAGSIQTVASFTGANGINPTAGLTAVGGTLYGTTLVGGTAGYYGTVFSYDPTSGSLTALASFSSGANGSNPTAGLTAVGGTLYGTTTRGGTAGYGTVFSYDPTSGSLTTLASFSGANGINPTAGLTDMGGTLYGTTYLGGTAGDGALFSYDPTSGSLTTLASFSGANGSNPEASLTAVGGTLYGTTASGGTASDGTIFTYQVSTSSTGVPEPGSLALLGTGLAGLGLVLRRTAGRSRAAC